MTKNNNHLVKTTKIVLLVKINKKRTHKTKLQARAILSNKCTILFINICDDRSSPKRRTKGVSGYSAASDDESVLEFEKLENQLEIKEEKIKNAKK